MRGMVAITLGLSLLATPAFAYIGPGAGITVLGALWGVIVAVVLALAAIVLWPLRALFRRRRKGGGTAEARVSMSDNTGDGADTSSPKEARF